MKDEGLKPALGIRELLSAKPVGCSRRESAWRGEQRSRRSHDGGYRERLIHLGWAEAFVDRVAARRCYSMGVRGRTAFSFFADPWYFAAVAISRPELRLEWQSQWARICRPFAQRHPASARNPWRVSRAAKPSINRFVVQETGRGFAHKLASSCSVENAVPRGMCVRMFTYESLDQVATVPGRAWHLPPRAWLSLP